METMDCTGKKTFYNYSVEPHETVDGRKFYPALTDDDDKPIVKSVTFQSTGLSADDDSRTLGQIIDHQLKFCPPGTTIDAVRADVQFGLKNRNTARFTKSLLNPTKLTSIKVVRSDVINLLVTSERASTALPICAGTASDDSVRALHAEMVEAKSAAE